MPLTEAQLIQEEDLGYIASQLLVSGQETSVVYNSNSNNITLNYTGAVIPANGIEGQRLTIVNGAYQWVTP